MEGAMDTINELPEKPEGWTRRMVCHMNYGKAGGTAQFSIHRPDGSATPIGYQYDTRLGGLTGFTLEGIKGVMTWEQLRVAWPSWVASRKNGGK
jgi:hypothetical protein